MKIFYLIFILSLCGFTMPENKKDVDFDLERLNYQVTEVKSAINRSAKYNSKIAFFIDMKIKSGYNRFFIYDLENDKILDKGLVAHGVGSETAVRGQLKFSNVPDSRSSSLGKYSIGKNYNGRFGKAYKLFGLDKTNDNAYKRAIVLHHHYGIPSDEQEYYIPNSHGCPVVNEAFFKRIEKIIDNSKTNIILNIYY